MKTLGAGGCVTPSRQAGGGGGGGGMGERCKLAREALQIMLY